MSLYGKSMNQRMSACWQHFTGNKEKGHASDIYVRYLKLCSQRKQKMHN